LRSEGSIWFRRAVDSDLETIAIASYSTYAALARARQKIHSDHEQYRYVEELYGHLQRSAEIGVKLIRSFNSFYEAVTHRRSSLSIYRRATEGTPQSPPRFDALDAEGRARQKTDPEIWMSGQLPELDERYLFIQP
jgi:hypothetical protein